MIYKAHDIECVVAHWDSSIYQFFTKGGKAFIMPMKNMLSIRHHLQVRQVRKFMREIDSIISVSEDAQISIFVKKGTIYKFQPGEYDMMDGDSIPAFAYDKYVIATSDDVAGQEFDDFFEEITENFASILHHDIADGNSISADNNDWMNVRDMTIDELYGNNSAYSA